MSDQSQTRRSEDLPSQSLGTRRETPFTYTPSLLEAIAYTGGGSGSWVSLNALRFTSLCPVTGQPDWAEITINFLPKEKLIESKALKEYLGSFRMHGDFHEDVIRIICDDLAACIAPRYIEVLGHFDSRGSVAIWPYAQYADANDQQAQALREHRFLNYSPGCWAADPRTVR
ncbi:MAG: preQ(1) synthase [Planctomycetota bacterium]|jgi:7-cyano-7-deazaguanine reductase|nr:preQ(1) synthase [Planctomycetota bacterium]